MIRPDYSQEKLRIAASIMARCQEEMAEARPQMGEATDLKCHCGGTMHRWVRKSEPVPGVVVTDRCHREGNEVFLSRCVETPKPAEYVMIRFEQEDGENG